MKSYLTTGLAFLLLTGCYSQSSIVGKYVSSEFGNIEFKEDSTYYYEGGSHALFERSEGEWIKLNHNRFMIFSDLRSTSVSLILEESEIDKGINHSVLRVDINVVNDGDISDYYCEVYINGWLHVTKRCDSLQLINIPNPIRNVYFKISKAPQISTTTALSAPLISDVFRTESRLGNRLNFKIYIDDAKFFYRSFNGYPIKVKRRNLYVFDIDNQQWKKLRKVSDDTNIFSGFGELLRKKESIVVFKFNHTNTTTGLGSMMRR